MSAPFIVRGVVLVGAALVTGILAYFAYRNATNNENAHQNRPHDDGPPPRPPGRNTELKNKCTVCLKEINPRDREFLKCNHMFHHDCYVDMLLKGERHCPRCFRRITDSELNAVLGGVEFLRDNQCCICLEPISNHDIKILNCNHQVHDDCFNDLIDNGGRNCPTCRRSIPQFEVREALIRRGNRRHRRMETH